MTIHHAQDDVRRRVAADIVSQLPQGTFNVSIDQAARILGCHPGHIRNQLSEHTFPIASIPIGSRRFIPLTNLVDYLAGLVISNAASVVPKRRRGPKTKAEKRMLRERQAHADLEGRA